MLVRRREDNVVEMRKKRRLSNGSEGVLLQSHNNLLDIGKKRRLNNTSEDAWLRSQNADFIDKRLESIPMMVQGLWSDDPVSLIDTTTEFRELLSIPSVRLSPPIDEVIKAGVVPRFVEFLGMDDLRQLQFEAAWVLTNVASGTSEHTQVVIEHGAVPMLLKLFSAASNDVREQAVWALGNIAGDSPSFRDLVLKEGALTPVLAQLHKYSKLSMLRNGSRTLSNFCRGNPPPKFEQVKPALPTLLQLIRWNDEEILTNVCRALSYLSDGPIDKIQSVIEAGFCPRLVELLLHPSPTVLKPALRTVGNIVMGDDAQTQAVIDANIMLPLVHILQHAEFDIKEEAAWAISNATSGGSHEQIQFLVSQGCVKPLCDLLICPDPRIVTVCLEGIENILKVGEADKEMGMNDGINLYAQMIDECEGLDKIDNLQTHGNNEIYEKAVKILERYRAEEELE